MNKSELYAGVVLRDDANESCILDNYSATSVKHIWNFYMYVVANGCITVLGVAGNCLSVVVWGRLHTTSIAVFLQSLAAFDMMCLLCSTLYHSLSAIYPYTGVFIEGQLYLAAIKTFVHPVWYITQLCSAWLVCMVSIDRYLAIKRPLHFRRFHKCSTARTVVLGILLATCIYCIPRFFEYIIEYEYDVCLQKDIARLTETDMFHNLVYKYTYYTIAYNAFYFFAPAVVVIFASVELIRSIKKSRAFRDKMATPGKKKSRNDITITLILVIMVFVVCITPDILLHVFIAVKYPQFADSFARFSSFFLVINHSANFIIYTACGTRFRRQVRLLFSGCHDNKNRKKSTSNAILVNVRSESTRF